MAIVLDRSSAEATVLDFARSRYLEYQDSRGRWQTDPSADLGRITRQQIFVRKALHKALSGLRRVYREAVVLRDIEGLAYDEIATALDISIGTVKSRLARGRQELRRKLEGSL